jgi:hypothetical protein
MKGEYFGAHEFQAQEEVLQISSERTFGLVLAVFLALLGGVSIYAMGTGWRYLGA